MQLTERSSFVLQTLIKHFIADGKPLASKALVEHTGLDLSAATIRSILAKLEEMGLVTSLHNASAKTPTAKGYRFFVDSILVDNENYINKELEDSITKTLEQNKLNIKQAISYTSKTISYFSNCASLIFTDYGQDILQKIEFIQISSCKLLIIFISNNDVQNYIINTTKEYSQEQILEAASFINSRCVGLTMSNIHTRLEQDLHALQKHILELTQVTLSVDLKNESSDLHVDGEHKLIKTDLSNNIQELKKLFELFDEKQTLLKFLQECSTAKGIKIFIGSENNVFPINTMSVVTMPFMDKTNLVGSLAIIGPVRMEYKKIISMLEVSSKIFQKFYT